MIRRPRTRRLNLVALEARDVPVLFNPVGTLADANLGPRTTVLAAGKFNNDDFMDLAVTNHDSGNPNTLSVVFGNAAGTFGTVTKVSLDDAAAAKVGRRPEGVVTFDFDGDTDPDLAAVLNEGTTKNVVILRNDGLFTGNFKVDQIRTAGANATHLVSGDFDGDIDPDLAVSNFGGGVSILRNNSTIFDDTVPPVNSGGTGGNVIVAADLDFDFDLDLAVANQNDGTIGILTNKGTGIFILTGAPLKAAELGTTFLAAGDLNGDTLVDLVASNTFHQPTMTAGKTVNVFLNKGGLQFDARPAVEVGAIPAGVVIADFNGEGLPDIAVGVSSVGKVAILRNDGNGGFLAPLPFGSVAGTNGLLVADPNRDNQPDLIVTQFDAPAPANKLGVLFNALAPTTTAVTSPPAGTITGSVTFTATVTAVGATPGSGFVSFLDGPNFLGTSPVTGGKAMFTPMAPLAPGKHAIRAVYGDVVDLNFFGSSSASVDYTVPAPNSAPTISDIPNQPPVAVGKTVGAVAFTVNDAETAADKLMVSAASSNTMLVPVANVMFGGAGKNRTVAVTPAAGQSGMATITVTVTDAGGLTASDTFTVTVTPAGANAPPTISEIADKTINSGGSTGQIAFTIGDDVTPTDQLVVTFASSNEVLVPATSIVPGGASANRAVTITPAFGQVGSAVITVTVRDTAGATAARMFTVTVISPGGNTPPTLAAIPDQSVSVGGTLNVPLTVGDAETLNGVTVTAMADNVVLVPNANLVVTGTGAGRNLAVTPAAGQTGTTMITVTVTDPPGAFNTRTFSLNVTPVGTNNPPSITDVPNQTAVTAGTTVGPITFTVNDAETAPAALTVRVASSNTGLVPAVGLALGGAGANRTLTITPTAGQTGTAVITLTVTDGGGNTASDTFSVAFTAPGGGGGGGGVIDPRPALVGFPQFAVGSGPGRSPTVQFFNSDKSVLFSVDPFPGLSGGVRTAAADFNADGVADLVVGTGPGRATLVRVLDGKTQVEMFSIAPFEATFVGGVYVAAGDLTGDGVPELVITPDEGGGPRCRVFNGKGFGVLADFFGIDDPNFRGGARAATGDVNGDGAGDLIVAAGFQGGPRVAGFSGKSLGSGPVKVFGDFFAFEQTLRNGTFVAAGDIDGDGFAEVIAGGGPGGGPRVTAFSGKSLLSNALDVRANFFGGDPNNRGGVRVTVKDLDGDNRADLVVGAGDGAGSRVTTYLGKNIAAAGAPAAGFDFDAFGGFAGGVFVG